MDTARYFWRYLAPEKAKLCIVFFLQLLRPFVGGLSFFLVVPLIAHIGIIETGNQLPAIFSWIPTELSLAPLLTGFFCLLLLLAAVDYIISTLSEDVEQHFLKNARVEIFTRLMTTEWKHFSETHQLDYARILSDELETASFGMDNLFRLAGATTLILVYTSISLALSVQLTLLAIALGVLMVGLSLPFRMKIIDIGERGLDASQLMLREATRQVRGMKAIRSNNAEAKHTDRFNATTDALQLQDRRFNRLHAGTQLGQSALAAMTFCIICYVAVSTMEVSTASLVLIALIFSRLLPKAREVTAIIQQFTLCIPSMRESARLLAFVEDHQEAGQKQVDFDPRQGIKLGNVSFNYPGSDRKVLDGLNLSLPGTGLIAVTGITGAGKSTLIDIIAGIHLPTAGEVMVGNQSVDAGTIAAWRREVTYVPQDPYVIDGTIRDNLILLQSEEISDEVLYEALAFASASFVSELPAGLDTFVGDGGKTLSGGERQRLLLARALIAPRHVVILDETTSQLDLVTEAEIVDLLKTLKRDKLLIVISHRPAISASADLVICLDEHQQRG